MLLKTYPHKGGYIEGNIIKNAYELNNPVYSVVVEDNSISPDVVISK